MHRKFILLCLCIILPLSISLHTSAHSGRTDANGGHTDHSTGKYHYHHGYPAHDHYDIDGDGIVDCPYELDDKTNHGGGSNFNNSTENITDSSIDDKTSQSGGNTSGNIAEDELPIEDKELKEVPVWVYWLIAGLCCTIAVLVYIIKCKNDQIAKQMLRFRQNASDEELKVKEGISALHNALVKNYGEEYLYMIAGAKPGDIIGADVLPHSASYLLDPAQDRYTFYLGGFSHYGSKYHHRKCRYARTELPVNAYHLRNRRLNQPCSLCPCRLPDTSWVDRYMKFHAFLTKYVDLSQPTANLVQKLQQNPLLGNVTYDIVAQQAFEMGVSFDTSQRIINHQRQEIGLDPVCYREKSASVHPDEGILDKPNIKINWRDK